MHHRDMQRIEQHYRWDLRLTAKARVDTESELDDDGHLTTEQSKEG